MKLRTDEEVRNNLMLSMGSMALGFAVLMLGFKNIGYGWIFAGSVLTLGALYNATKPKENFIEDERSLRNKEKAGYHAFNTMLILIITFNLLYIYKIWMPLPSQIYALLFFVGIYVWLTFQWMYNKKGE
ncbi:MAG: hypothetical protein KAR87_04160 [Candidatus Aenigmarchaeota archaeon]|nr:hypothetical protein [Candidatus Aenigmarchaeota archaeon]